MQIDQHSFHGLLHSADLIEAELRRQLAPLGLQPRQARVLEAMGRMGPVSQVDLAQAFDITPASMSTMTDRLLDGGYITRTISKTSRRQNVLELTDKGRTLLKGVADAWSTVDQTIVTVLGADAGALFELASRLRDGLGGKIPGKRPRPAPDTQTE
ncbi:MarR family transcriptional regulator [Rhodobacteraceae bacterium KMM 6894]|nr:MarR family transcriptional regulator [Rhodobacteraceae bacterium KMM 6894]